MDFDPEHPKWFCWCCHLTHGLVILASSEIVLSVLLLCYFVACITVPNPDEQHDSVSWFTVVLMSVSAVYCVTSALLIFGIRKYKVKLMYPTLVARTIIVVFMQLFGVSTIVRPSHYADSFDWRKSDDQKMDKNLIKKKTQKETTVAQRLVILMFIMMLISIFVFYTLYLIVRCIRYVKAHKRLLYRKRSTIIARSIDPTEIAR
ncbi:unnamed protein product [Litomosoides sigmodontis]|uniref:DUF7027 domain-containing protein n=1 Tax=Litomosoides sigmodontis TaxID=42156 RepID=A0A3P6TW14_LITSI|nr:unnamed protein product [Litomosoides sigmodontis]